MVHRLIESKFMDNEARESRFESLYSAHSAEILRFAVRCGADRVDAEEIVEETFLICWRRLDDVPEPALPWLIGVAKRVLSNRRRSDSRLAALRRRLAHAKPDPPPGRTDDSTLHEEVRRALSSLRDADREVIELLVWQELTQDQAAEVLGCTRNAVTKRFRRARSRLEALLPSIRTLL
jgi:RNA polymerase sigma-70 factor, ECF subfamily